MSKIKEKETALELRKRGNSIADISEKLKVSKSTVSYWCRDISLSEEAKIRIIQSSERKSTAGILKYTEGLRRARMVETKEDHTVGSEMVGILTKRELLFVGLGLYWGEGYKKGSQEFGFTNSDPAMITFYIKWLEICFGVSRDNLIARVSVNESYQVQLRNIELFWSEITGLQLSQFTKVSLIKIANKKVYQNRDSHYGTLRIKVRRGTRLRRRVIGAINHMAQQQTFK